MEEQTDRRDTLLNQGLAHLQQALDAPTAERAQERLQGARAVASNLGRIEGGDPNRRILAIHGTRVRNILSNRDLLANADDASQLAECVYCKTLVYPIPAEDAQQSNWNNSRCLEHQDENRFPEPQGGPGS